MKILQNGLRRHTAYKYLEATDASEIHVSILFNVCTCVLEHVICRGMEPCCSPLQAIDIDHLAVLHQLRYLHFPLPSHIRTECLNYVVSTAFPFVQGNMQICPPKCLLFSGRKVM